MVTCLLVLKGLVLGILLGLANIAPMIIMRFPVWASVSSFLMWAFVGFILATSGFSVIPPYLQSAILFLAIFLNIIFYLGRYLLLSNLRKGDEK